MIELLNATTDDVRYAVCVTETATNAQIDLMGITLPTRARIKVTDPNGFTVTTSDPLDVCGGDIWTFDFTQTY
jgi:hypothetical protein